MALEDIKKELEQKFNEPLEEFYKRRIIFWQDEAKEFINEIEDLTLSNAKVLILNETNQFVSKKLLSHDDLESNYLVYNPLTSDMENDWFLDIKLYSEEYRSDITSRYMQELNIENTPALRHVVKGYSTFLNAVSRRRALAKVECDIDKPSKFHLAVIAAICGLKTIDHQEIIRSVLMDGEDISNHAKLEMLKYGASDAFWALVDKKTGYIDEKRNIDDLNLHIVLSAVSKTCDKNLLDGLDDYYNPMQNEFCYDLVTEWAHSKDKESFYDIARFVEEKLQLLNRFRKSDVDALMGIECLPCIEEVILEKLMKDVLNHLIDADKLIHVIENRRTTVWYEKYACYYDGLMQVANIFKFYNEHMNSFHDVKAEELWKKYTQDYYKMDTYYRLFHVAYALVLQDANPLLDDLFKQVVEEVEKEYKNWFLDKLASNWTNVIEKDLDTVGYVEGIEKQKDFYLNYVNNAEGKIYVIISDALRYEVAASLADELRLDRSKVELNSMQSVFPSITKFGMSALLPHKKISIDNKNGMIKVLVDNKTSEMSDRDSLLKAYNPASVALKYKDFIVMKRDEKRNAVKGKDVVYIYHDTIDSASHNDDTGVFKACDEAIDEIKNLINIITSTLNGINIIVTADHGFLYTYDSLNEEDKVERSSFVKDIIEQGRRYALCKNDAKPDYLMHVHSIYGNENVEGFTPRENIRIKGAGGQNFVHGGVSLQEMVVPVIQYRYLRAGYKSYVSNKDMYDTKSVTLSLLSSSHKITNKIFTLSFYQKEAVRNNFVPCVYEIFMTDESGQTVSDKHKIIADRTSEKNKDREYKCLFNLKPIKFSHKELYYLVIQDEKGLQVPVKEEFTIDIAMAFDDFDF